MEKRIVVAGSGYYENYEEAKEFITECTEEYKTEKLILLSGRCRGADILGERFAVENQWEIEFYPAEWQKYGKAAGPIRNSAMVDKAKAWFVFGTAKAGEPAR